MLIQKEYKPTVHFTILMKGHILEYLALVGTNKQKTSLLVKAKMLVRKKRVFIPKKVVVF